jgi:hypothetical protein
MMGQLHRLLMIGVDHQTLETLGDEVEVTVLMRGAGQGHRPAAAARSERHPRRRVPKRRCLRECALSPCTDDVRRIGRECRAKGVAARTFVVEEFIDGEEWFADGIISGGLARFGVFSLLETIGEITPSVVDGVIGSAFLPLADGTLLDYPPMEDLLPAPRERRLMRGDRGGLSRLLLHGR